MLWDSSALIGYGIESTDGRLGTISDLQFEDVGWTVRQLVIDTGTWLPGRKVFLPMSALGAPDLEQRHIPVTLTLQQAEAGLGIADQTVQQADTDLYSVRDLIGYHVHATDGDIGHVENLLIDASGWSIRFITIHTSSWWPGERILMPIRSVGDIDRIHSRIDVDVMRSKIRSGPRFDPAATVDGAYEEEFLTYYGIKWVKKDGTKLPSASV